MQLVGLMFKVAFLIVSADIKLIFELIFRIKSGCYLWLNRMEQIGLKVLAKSFEIVQTSSF